MKRIATDVVIVGGGMVGMTLAVALAREHVRVAVVDSAAQTAQMETVFDGRVSALALSSKRLLDAIGAWDGMAPHAEPILDIRVSDQDALTFLHYDHAEIGDAPFGYIVENRRTRKALFDTATALASLQLFAPTKMRSLRRDQARAEVELEDGTAIEAALVVGADGKRSQIRNMLGIGAVEWPYSHTAIVCTIAHSLPHRGLAQERFLAAGPFAVLPMTEQRCSLVWTEPHALAKAMVDLPETDFVAEIERRVGGYLGAISTAGPRFTYPLSLMHARQYVSTRAALAGDAAHAIHPIAGQGVNLGFRDAAVLAELIAEYKALGLDIGSDTLLARYQQWRRFDAAAMTAVTDGLNRLFSNNIAPIKLARRAGLALVGKLPSLKRFFMRHAMGVTGDVPKLMRG